jgi:hypothetical protein
MAAKSGFEPNVPPGNALVAKAAGLVGHINEDIEEPMACDI